MRITGSDIVPYVITSVNRVFNHGTGVMETHRYVSVNGDSPRHTAEYQVYDKKAMLESSRTNQVDVKV